MKNWSLQLPDGRSAEFKSAMDALEYMQEHNLVGCHLAGPAESIVELCEALDALGEVIAPNCLNEMDCGSTRH